MKRSLFCALVLGFIIALGGTGCKHGTKGPTPIPGSRVAPTTPNNTPFIKPLPEGTVIPAEKGPTGGNLSPNIEGDNLKPSTNGIPMTGIEKFQDRPVDREVFKAYTVYFEFDRAVVREKEKSKLEAVADYMKSASADKDLLVEGHCDERGTEEYNRALGERRAQAIREYLVNLGLSASRIQTVSYGKDKPLDPEHNEEAWAKNRRGEFGLLLPKQ